VIPGVITAAVMLFLEHNLWPRFFFFAIGFGMMLLMRGAFLWFAAWLFPAWCVLLLRQLNVADGFYWLGFGVPALLLLALAHWLRRFERTYAWPLYSAAQFYTLAGLLISAPLAAGFFAGQFKRPPENLLVLLEASGFVVLQTLAVVFYAASARVFRWRLFAYVAALLTFFPYTFAWLIYTPLESARFAWPWMAWAGALLGAGFGLDQWEKQAAPARPSGMPQPVSVSGEPAREAVALSASTIHTAGQSGRACMRQAARPATSGAENEVPLERT